MSREQRDALIVELRRQNKTHKEIAAEVGCGLATIRKALRQYQGDDICQDCTSLFNKRREQELKAKYCPDGYDLIEYHPGHSKSYVVLRCKTCGNVRTLATISFRGANAGHNHPCPECVKREREQRNRDQQRERAKRQREKELKRKTTQLLFNVCPICSSAFIGSSKFCSQKCRKKASRTKASRTTYRHMRRTHMKAQIVDTDITLQELARRDNDVCYLCGGKIDWSDYVLIDSTFVSGERYPSMDHVIPLSKQGKHAWDNVRLAHLGCNRNKGAEIV